MGGPTKPDDWHKPRGPGLKLTPAEIQRIRVAFNCGRPARDIARELQCSLRIANKYYGIFRGPKPKAEKIVREKPQQEQPQKRPMPAKSRFYTSTFELEGQTG